MTTEMVKIASANVDVQETKFGVELIERWIKFTGVKPASVKTYSKCLRQLFAFFNANGIRITSATRDDLQNWILGLRGASENDKAPAFVLDDDCVLHYDGEIAADGDVYKVVGKADTDSVVKLFKGTELVGKSKSAATVKLYVVAVKLFFRWLLEENIIQKDVADRLKAGVKVSSEFKKDYLGVKECRELIESVKPENKDDLQNLRNRAVIMLMSISGLRCCEVIRADVGNLTTSGGKVFLHVWGKGCDSANARVLVSKQTFAAIREYLKARGIRVGDKNFADAPLFASTSRRNFGQRLSTSTISHMVKKSLRGLGYDTPRLTAHSLRHSTASNMIAAGIELSKVQNTLRHSSPSMTTIYVGTLNRDNNVSEQTLSDLIFERREKKHGRKTPQRKSKRNSK